MSNEHAQPNGAHEVATLAGGCFWCLEPVFDDLKGVTDVVSGYAGGHAANPTYRQVCAGTTGHAEVVQVTFDPQVVSFRELLEVFFTIHDPTTLNRQGADVGTQYRSAIFYHSPEQKATAEQVISTLTPDSNFEFQRIPNGTNIFRMRVRNVNAPVYGMRLEQNLIDARAPASDWFSFQVNETWARVPASVIVDRLRKALG